MTIAVEAIQGASGLAVTSVSSPSITPLGLDRLLIAFGANSAGAGAPVAYSDMTFGGAQMTPKWDRVQQTIIRNVCEFIKQPSLSGGVVQYSLAGSQAIAFVACVSLSGVDQSNPLDAEVEATVAAATAAISATTPSEVGDLVMDWFFGGGTSIAINNGNTLQAKMENISGTSAGISTKAGAASVTTGWLRTGTTLPAGMVVININANTGSIVPNSRPSNFVGVGIGIRI